MLDKLLTCNPKDRITAAQALDHEYFWTDPLPADPKTYADVKLSINISLNCLNCLDFPPTKRLMNTTREVSGHIISLSNKTTILLLCNLQCISGGVKDKDPYTDHPLQTDTVATTTHNAVEVQLSIILVVRLLRPKIISIEVHLDLDKIDGSLVREVGTRITPTTTTTVLHTFLSGLLCPKEAVHIMGIPNVPRAELRLM